MTQPRQYEQPSNGRFWSVAFGNSPVIGTAIHDGHEVRPELMPFMGLSDDERLREEDPFTGETVDGLTSRIVVHRSRFEIDLNRARDQAIYLKPEQSWGLSVWKEPLPRSMIDDSLSFHDDYYGMLEGILAQMQQRHGRFVVLDIHSYNHRRQGPSGALTPQSEAPDINIGTPPWIAIAGPMSSMRWVSISLR
jgi:N-formylglutamate amidohydrolase